MIINCVMKEMLPDDISDVKMRTIQRQSNVVVPSTGKHHKFTLNGCFNTINVSGDGVFLSVIICANENYR